MRISGLNVPGGTAYVHSSCLINDEVAIDKISFNLTSLINHNINLTQ